MTISASQTVGELARNLPGSARIFESYGIDYCCGGNRELRDACSEKGLPVEQVVDALKKLAEADEPAEKDWNLEPLNRLIEHILGYHHETVRREIPRLENLIAKMCEVHGSKRQEFLTVRSLVGDLASELQAHLQKEEVVLFPYICQLESALETGAAPPRSCFGSVTAPIVVMLQEHDNAGELLKRIQGQLTDRTGCPTCLEFFRTVDAFESDLHQHIHLENNILFPKAVELEAGKIHPVAQ